ncbi:hypothetical protein QAA18_08590, partial [Luteimonas sp. 8-5]|nr:hypothetical protein [Luteimonas sp. 8-5]
MSRPVHRLALGALLALVSLTALGADKGQQRLIGFNADFITQGVPTTMVAGQSYAVSVTMSNNGSDGYDWYDAALESQNPTGNTTWGLSQVPVGTSVPPGYDHIFNFTVVAPSTPGTYNFQWRMRVISGSLRFGDLTPNVAVVVTAAPPPVPTLTLPTSSATGSYTASWSSSTGATHYELSEKVGTGSWSVIQDTSATSRAI